MKKQIALIIILVALLLLSAPLGVNAAGTDVSGSVPLVIVSAPTVSNLTATTATITWTTNGVSSTLVYYRINGSTVAYGSQTGSDSSSHSLTLTGLTASTSYEYSVKSVLGSLEAVSAVLTFTTTAASGDGGGNPGGGGGGGGAPPVVYTPVALSGLTSPVPLRLDSTGLVEKATSVSTGDNLVKLDIASGTKLLNSSGKPITSLDIKPVTPPALPSGYAIVFAYDFSPEGATFSSPLTVTFSFDPEDLPQGVAEKDLIIAHWDGTQWLQRTDGVLSAENHTITFTLEHFSQYAVIGKTQNSPVSSSAATATPTFGQIQTPTPSSTSGNPANPTSTLPVSRLLPPAVSQTTPALPKTSSAPVSPAVPAGPSFLMLLLVSMGVFIVSVVGTVIFALKRRN